MPTDTVQGAHLEAELSNPALTIVAHLAKSPIPVDADSVPLEGIVECDFPGYEPKVLTDHYIDVFDDTTYAEAFFPEVEWQAEDVVTPQLVTAVYVTLEMDGVGIVLNNISILETPLVIDTPGQTISRNFSVMATNAAED